MVTSFKRLKLSLIQFYQFLLTYTTKHKAGEDVVMSAGVCCLLLRLEPMAHAMAHS